MNQQPRAEKNGQIVKPEQPKPSGGGGVQAQMKAESLEALLLMEKTQKEFARAMPGRLTGDRMLRICLTALRTTKNLIRCSPDSFLACIFQAGQLGLEPNTPLQHCFLIPRRNYKKENELRARGQLQKGQELFECTMMLGYQGMLELSYRSDRIVDVTADTVHEGDTFRCRKGLVPILEHEDSDFADREKRYVTHAYAIATLTNGGKPWIALSRPQIDARRARSSSPEEGPWVDFFDAMSQKSALRALWKFLPKSSDMAIAEQLEQQNELGRTQASVFGFDIRKHVENLGVQPLEVDDDLGQLPVPSADAPLSEVLAQGAQERETVKKE